MMRSLIGGVCLTGMLLLASNADAQVLIGGEDFEDADFTGYSISDGPPFGVSVDTFDYFIRGMPSDFTFEFGTITGHQGSYLIGLEDIDGAGFSDPQWLALDAITITGYEDISVDFLFAAPNTYPGRYDLFDFFIVEYSIDSGSFVKIAEFRGINPEGSGGTNPGLYEDTDLNGSFTDMVNGLTMQRFTYSLDQRAGTSVTGDSLVVRFRFSSADPQGELAFDDVRVTATQTPCVSDAECDDSNECTNDVCNAGVCDHTNKVLGTSCGDTGTECVNQDTCDGSGSCTDNGFKTNGTSCGSSATECSGQDTCDGSGTCQPNHLASTADCGGAATECENQDKCDGSGSCTDNGFKTNGTSCGDSATDCSGQDTCDGSGTCLPNHLPSTTDCGDTGTECVNQDKCDGSGSCSDNGFKSNGTNCGDSATECSGQDTCNGSGVCLPNHLPSTTDCGDGPTDCSRQDTCNGSGTWYLWW